MRKIKAYDITLLGMLAAVTLTLTFLETLLPPIAFLPPGFKIGISNVAVMYTLFSLNFVSALFLVLLKSAFVLMINGGYAAALSLLGSILAISVMWGMIRLFKQKVSYAALSVSGAVMHNIAQLALVFLITSSASVFYYFPVLLIASIICGTATASATKLLIPLMDKIKNNTSI